MNHTAHKQQQQPQGARAVRLDPALQDSIERMHAETCIPRAAIVKAAVRHLAAMTPRRRIEVIREHNGKAYAAARLAS